MNRLLNTTRTAVRGCLLVAACGFSATSFAGDLALSDSPLFLVASVEPNVFFLIDDSGSMEFEVLIESEFDGVGLCDRFGDPDSCYMAGNYVLPTTNNGFDKGYIDRSNALGLSPAFYPSTILVESDFPGHGIWRLRNSSYNKMYYNPEITYEPWAGTDAGGNALYTDAPEDAAPVDPSGTIADTFDLTSDVTFYQLDPTTGGQHEATLYPARYYTWTDTDTDGEVDVADGHALVEIKAANAPFARSNRTDCADPTSCTYAEEITNFANWFTYHRKRAYLAQATMGKVIDDQSGVRVGLRAYNNGHLSDALTMTDAANKRAVLNTLYGARFQCDSVYIEIPILPPLIVVRLVTTLSCPSTPARAGLSDLGQHFKGVDSPIETVANGGECQQNFDITVSDGFWNGSLDATQTARYGDDDSDDNTDFDGGDYADTDTDDGNPNSITSRTLADIAMYYYENDLDGTLDDKVPTLTDVDEAEHQHLVSYSIAFGISGTLDPDGDQPGDAGFAWPEVEAGTLSTVDDLWHASFNGRGQYFNAQNPSDLADALGDTFQSIADRTASASSVALTSGSLSTGSLLFQSKFNSGDWSSQLLAYSIVSSGVNIGQVGGLVWDASCELTGGSCTSTGGTSTGQTWNNRVILTSIPPTGAADGGTGVAFRWPADPAAPTGSEITVAQVASLHDDPDTVAVDNDGNGEDRLEHLRGASIAGMRERTSLLGDIVDSSAAYVGAPPFAYPDSLETPLYSAFVSARSARTPILYVGANDGMLHGFNASSTIAAGGGQEEIAYVPSEVYENLSRLTSTHYGGSVAHRYFVNASPTAGDVVIGGAWKTILVGGLGKGGQGIYALDITDPSSFSEANASSLVLWEYTDARDRDLGYTYGDPAIVRLANGKWGVIVSGGYNQTEADGNASGDGDAHIFIINVATGRKMKEFDTKVGKAEDPTLAARPNGIKTVTPVDVDADHIVDYIYAGDLFGNVWKLDVTSSAKADWGFAFKSGSTPVPLFVAKDSNGDELPITSTIEAGLHPTLPGQMVYFGTGKYLEDSDHVAAGQQTQGLFAVWDRNEASGSLSTITRSHLLAQTIEEETTHASGSEVRLSTQNTIAWYGSSGLPTTPATQGYLGWYMDLLNTEGGNTNNYGERVVADPILSDGRIIFVTLMPSSHPCDYGGDSWLMELDAYSGARLDVSPFDFSGDGSFTTSDLVDDASGNPSVASGVKSKVGILPSPGILRDTSSGYGGGSSTSSGREFKYFSGSSGSISVVTEYRNVAGIGRQSWRQIK